MKRYSSIIRVKPEKLEEYKRLHAAVWPEVVKMISVCNIRNYSIFYKDGILFSYFEYIGTDYTSDMEKMAADPVTIKWWEFVSHVSSRLKQELKESGGQIWRKYSIKISYKPNGI